MFAFMSSIWRWMRHVNTIQGGNSADEWGSVRARADIDTASGLYPAPTVPQSSEMKWGST